MIYFLYTLWYLSGILAYHLHQELRLVNAIDYYSPWVIVCGPFFLIYQLWKAVEISTAR
jgi:hypothetical protein